MCDQTLKNNLSRRFLPDVLRAAFLTIFTVCLVSGSYVYADNPILTTMPDLRYDGQQVAGSIKVDAGATSVAVTTTETGTWEYKLTSAGTWTTLTSTLTFPSAIGEGEVLEYDLRYTAADGSCWHEVITVYTSTSDNSNRYDDVDNDVNPGPVPSGCCASSQCSICHDCIARASGSHDYDPDPEPYSIQEMIPLAADPNEPDFEKGGLWLYRSRLASTDNAGDRNLLQYIGVPTMKVLTEDDSPAGAGLVYTCTIRQASGFSVDFAIKSGENFGRPTGVYIHSGARIQLLDGVNGSVVTNPASATHVKHYRQNGGIMVYTKSTGDPDQYTTRTGRVNSDPAAEVEIYEPGGNLTQVKSAAGLLVIDEVNSRKYTVKRYYPSQISGSSAPYTINSGEDPVMTVTVEHPSSTASIEVTREIDGRKTLNDWEYSTAANYNMWSVTRKVWDGSAWETAWTKERKVEDVGATNKITRNWKESGGTVFHKAEISTSVKEWGPSGPKEGTSTDGSRELKYHGDSTKPGEYGKVSEKTDRAGIKTKFDYNADGRMTERKGYYLDTADKKVEEFSYTLHEGGAGEVLELNDYRPRTTTVKYTEGANTRTAKKTMFAGYTDSTSDEYTEETQIAHSPTAAWDASSNLVTKKTYYDDSAAAVAVGRLKQIEHPNGDITKYSYTAGSTAASALTVTVDSELNSSGNAITGRSKRSITVYDALGRVREVTRGIYVNSTSGWVNYEKSTDNYSDGSFGQGPFGYRYRKQLTDLGGSNVRTIMEYEWDGGQLVGETDEAGTETSYEYDITGRLGKTTREAVATGSGYAAQTAVVTAITSTTSQRKGAIIGYKNETTTVTAGSLTLESKVVRDDWGRVTASTDQNGYTTDYAYTDSGRMVTKTRPDGKTEITDYYKDGRMDSVTGTGVVHVTYDYELPDATTGDIRVETKLGTLRTSHVTTNMLGQRVSTEKKTLDGGTTVVTTKTTYHYEAGTGDLERISSDADDTPHRLFSEDADRTTKHTAVSTDTTMDFTTASDDRIERVYTWYYYSSISGELWRYDEYYVFPDNGGSPVNITVRSTQMSGFASNEISKAAEYSPIHSELGQVTTTLSAGVRTTNTYKGSISEDAVFVSYHGRMVKSTQPGQGDTTYSYDDLGRRTSTVHPRTGTTSMTYKAHPTLAGKTTTQVASVTTGGDTTSYDYYADNTHGAGRVKTVTRPDSSTVKTSYTALGQVQAQWGGGTYARYYVYDSIYGDLTDMRTYQGISDGTEPTSATTGYKTTTWNYNATTGQLTSKDDANSKGVDYTYDTAGRVLTREWARTGTSGNRIKTTYAYTGFGQLDTVTYSNDPESTPSIDYDYDHLGRVSLVTQGTKTTHEYVYTTSTYHFSSLDREIVDYDIDRDGTVDLVREFDHQWDWYLRSTGYEFKLEGGANITRSGYNYDSNAGRLEKVWHEPTSFSSGIPQGTADFTYSYRYSVSGSLHKGTSAATSGTVFDSGIPFHISGPDHDVVNSYEDDRNVLNTRENQEKSGNDDWSKYVYTVNSLGQRTALDLTLDSNVDGAGLVSSDVTEWDYNARGELVKSDHEITAHERAYKFDSIGNRKETVSGTTTLTGTDDYTANDVNEYTKVEGTTLPTAAYDDDGNLIDDGTREYVWDAENRLIRVTDGTNTIAEYVYDYMGRRIAKETTSHASQGAENRVYFYHGWNLAAEYTTDSSWANEDLDFTYTWGLDLSGSLQGAGGVGGLLVAEKVSTGDSGEYYPTYDGNGNVSEYIDSSGTQVAHYEYDPFGNQLSLSSGTLKDLFTFKFSTKYEDKETGFYYYGYRYYDPVAGRWIRRDPIEEEGGLNLYHFMFNDALGGWDYLGLLPSKGNFRNGIYDRNTGNRPRMERPDDTDLSGTRYKRLAEIRVEASQVSEKSLDVAGAKAALFAHNASSEGPRQGDGIAKVFNTPVEYGGRICCNENGDYMITGPVTTGSNSSVSLSGFPYQKMPNGDSYRPLPIDIRLYPSFLKDLYRRQTDRKTGKIDKEVKKEIDKRVGHTGPLAACPEGWREVGGYHNHPGGYDSIPSPQDRVLAKKRPEFIAGSKGENDLRKVWGKTGSQPINSDGSYK